MLLLDTQAALWLLDDSPRLGTTARTRISTATVVHVSAASVWELTIKSMIGKVRVPDDFSTQLKAQGLALLPITALHSERIRDFPDLTRHDPFDRLLMAQALVEGLTLVTADQVLLTTGHSWLVDARD
jgi:PIN domain nuclease of toxin-antitoxin system